MAFNIENTCQITSEVSREGLSIFTAGFLLCLNLLSISLKCPFFPKAISHFPSIMHSVTEPISQALLVRLAGTSYQPSGI